MRVTRILFFFSIAVLFLIPQTSATEENVKDILRKIAYSYKKLNSLTDTFKILASIPAIKEKSELSFNVAFKKPNKILIEAKNQEEEELLLASDGKNLYTYVSTLKAYKKEKAPRKIPHEKNMEPQIANNFTISITISLILAENPYKELIESVTAAKPAKIERLYDKDVYFIEMEQKLKGPEGIGHTPSTLKLWIDKENYIILKSECVIEMLISATGEKTHMFILEEHPEIKVNEKVDDNIFKFIPPKNTKKVKKFNFPAK